MEISTDTTIYIYTVFQMKHHKPLKYADGTIIVTTIDLVII